VGVLLPTPAANWMDQLGLFRERLRELGWIEGQNLTLDVRSAGNEKELPALAAELISLNPDAVFASAAATRVAIQATTTIPIVFETLADAVSAGYVPNLARPGGNVTGISGFSPELAAKQLQFVRETLPRAARIAVLKNATNPSGSVFVRVLGTAAQRLDVRLDVVDVRRPSEVESAVEKMIRQGAQALIVVSDPMFVSQARQIVELATRHRLPIAAEVRDFTEAGGLLSYGPRRKERWRQAAEQLDRILRGAKPGDLPVEQPTKFELVINLKTAKALGLTIPQSVLFRADEVIE